MAPQAADASTRERVARSILTHGPSTAGELAGRLGLTAAAVRRHLALLLEMGFVSSHEQRIRGSRGRGRPAHVYALTDRGRGAFYQAYDVLALDALRYLEESAGPDAVKLFADKVVAGIEERFRTLEPTRDTALDALVEALSEEGYVASLKPVATGQQLCQYHCPVANVARQYPQLCEAETQIFSRLLNSHVQRLATIAHGEVVCNTHVPRPVEARDTRGKAAQ